jgi:hypothetical protein
VGKKNSKPPPAPDPRAVAQAQTGSNVGTAIANAWLGNANEYTPYGGINYNQTGTQQITVDGQTYDIPQFERVQWLDPTEQGLLDQQRMLGYGMNNLAANQVGRLDQHLGTPISGESIWPQRVTDVPNAPQFEGAVQGPGLYGVNLGRMSDTVGNDLQYGVDMNDPRTWFGQSWDIQRSIGPTDYSEDRQRVEEALLSRMNPDLQRDREQLETTLMNQGFTRGSEAFNQAMDEMTRQTNDARMGAILAGGQEQSRLAQLALQSGSFANQAQQQQYGQALGRGQFYNQATDQLNAARLAQGQFANAAQGQAFQQDAARTGLNQEAMLGETGFNNQNLQQMWQNAMAGTTYNNQMGQMSFGNQMQQVEYQNALRERAIQEELAMRNQPINEITALMSGGQVNVPQFQGYNAPQMQAAPVGDYMYQSAAMDQNAWAQQQQARSSMLGGLFDLGGMAAYGYFTSDRRLKRNIERLGIKANGLDVYSYRYRWDNDNVRRVGVMADEVKRVKPAAVTSLGGYDTVDYGLAMVA